MDKRIKKGNLRMNRILKKYSITHLLSLCNCNSVLMGSFNNDELKMAEDAVTHQIQFRLEKIYSIFGRNLLELWNCPVISKYDFDNINYIDKLNLIIHYCNTLTGNIHNIINQLQLS